MVAAHRAGMPLREVAKTFNVTKSTVQRWGAAAKGKRLDRVDFQNKRTGPKKPKKSLIAQVKNNEPFPVFVRSSDYEHETRKFIVPSPHTASGGPVAPQRISQRRHHRHR